MLTSTLLVLLMTVPGLALFYGGLVRSKNVLSILMQVMTVFSLIVVSWVVHGYSLAFDSGNPVIGSFRKLFLHGVTKDSLADTFTSTVKLPEYVFVAFQSTVAGITGALASVCCVWGVTGLKKILRADDALDVSGVHGIGGIVGALLTGVFTAASLGGAPARRTSRSCISWASRR